MIARFRKFDTNSLRVRLQRYNVGFFRRIPSKHFGEAMQRTIPTTVTVLGMGRLMIVIDVGKGGGISGKRRGAKLHPSARNRRG